MGRQVGLLTALGVKSRLTKPGLYPDGGNLYLSVKAGADGALSKSWIFRYKVGSKKASKNGVLYQPAKDMGLGSLHTVSLARAREDAQRYRLMLHDGLDPMEQRKLDRTVKAGVPTFVQASQAYIDEHKAGWRNPKHVAQWENTLATYANPVIGDKSIDAVTMEDIQKILQPIWQTKTETATRVRQRIEAVLDAAKVKGQRTGDNPARWKGHLDKVFPKPSKVHTPKHFSALPFAKLPAFMKRLRKQTGTSARALEFLILTASRTNMVTKAERKELSESGDRWTVPATRMKAQREHVVPLSTQAQAIIDCLPKDGEPLFAGDRLPHLSNGAMDALLERMKCSDITVHGFRSTFRDWAAETTAFPGDVVEMALAHSIKDKTESAYRRGNLLEKRKELMQAWADFSCASATRKATRTTAKKSSH